MYAIRSYYADSNALGYPPDWYHKPDPEVEEPEEEPQQPLTLEEIEAVRQAAYEDGFAEGREAGLAKGLEEGKLLGLQQGHEAGFEQGKEEGLALGRELIESQATQCRITSYNVCYTKLLRCSMVPTWPTVP